jgi:hypothetical protein
VSGEGIELDVVISGLMAKVEGLVVEYRDVATSERRRQEILAWFKWLHTMLKQVGEEN